MLVKEVSLVESRSTDIRADEGAVSACVNFQAIVQGVVCYHQRQRDERHESV